MDHTIQVDPNSRNTRTPNLIRLSEGAAYIMERLSMRSVLRHQDGKLSWIVQQWEPGQPPTYPYPPADDPRLQMAAFWELWQADLIYRLSEEGEPPLAQRKGRAGEGWRSGWKEAGLDGADCELFVCMM